MSHQLLIYYRAVSATVDALAAGGRISVLVIYARCARWGQEERWPKWNCCVCPNRTSGWSRSAPTHYRSVQTVRIHSAAVADSASFGRAEKRSGREAEGHINIHWVVLTKLDPLSVVRQTTPRSRWNDWAKLPAAAEYTPQQARVGLELADVKR